jgi:hypothetical protein
MKRGLLIIALGLGFLIAITWLGTFATTYVLPKTTAQVQTMQVGPYDISLRVDPNPPSTQQLSLLTVQIRQHGSQQPVSKVLVTLAGTMETMDMGAITAVTRAQTAGTYVGSLQFAMSGPWQVQVLVSGPGQPVLTAIFTISAQ